jgi:hypothetical protein
MDETMQLSPTKVARRFPSPWWGGARGGGNPYGKCSAIPPSLSLPHEGRGDDTLEGLEPMSC